MRECVVEFEVWRLARRLIELYGGDAEKIARQRKDAAQDVHDLEDCRRWTHIIRAVRAMYLPTPERLHRAMDAMGKSH